MNKIVLANCHITQTTKEGLKSEWVVKNEGGVKIDQLNGDLNEHQAMESIHFARRWELEAFNIGIEYGKTLTKLTNKSELTDNERAKLHKVIKELTEANNVLAENLDKFTREN